jgi:hypothetical protein
MAQNGVESLFKVAYNGFGLGEVAFVRWLVCRKAILPNPCEVPTYLDKEIFN